MSHETTQKEIALAFAVGKGIFGRDDCVRFQTVTLDQRVPLLTSWSKVSGAFAEDRERYWHRFEQQLVAPWHGRKIAGVSMPKGVRRPAGLCGP